MINGKRKSGFTLAEMLIAVALFAIMSTLGAALFTNISRMQKKITLENAMLEDARYMMERIVRLARSSTIDYEEYYNQRVLSEFVSPAGYGDNYGYYATMFYHPSYNKDESPGVPSGDGGNRYYGAYYNGPPADISSSDKTKPGATNICRIGRSDRKLDLTSSYMCPPDTLTTKAPTAGYEVVLQDTVDWNSGQNPYPDGAGTELYTASAFCDDHKKTSTATVPSCNDYNQFFQQDELYLIDQYGQKKYIFAREKVKSSPDQYVLSFLTMDGEDRNLNNITDTWQCNGDYNCTKTNGSLTRADVADLTRADVGEAVYNDFIPISPLRANVVDLKFLVAPLEDPRKGFSENEKFPGKTLPEFMVQPHVTIVLTVEPAQDQLSGLEGIQLSPITLQTTVSSRVQHEVKSYGP